MVEPTVSTLVAMCSGDGGKTRRLSEVPRQGRPSLVPRLVLAACCRARNNFLHSTGFSATNSKHPGSSSSDRSLYIRISR